MPIGDSNVELIHNYKIPKTQIPRYMQQLDIGIVPYPNEYHMSNYASPLKVFEYAAASTVILCSDIKSNLELIETGLGIMYFKAGDFDDFRDKVVQLITNSDLRNSLIEKSKKNIINYSLNHRMKKLIKFFNPKKWIKKMDIYLLVNNFLNQKYISNGYWYSYDDNWTEDGKIKTIEGVGYYPQAGINFFLGTNIEF